MALYTNHSRHPAIVTINIQTTADASKSIQKGTKQNFENIQADVGVHDLIVEAGLELKLAENTTATVVGVRADA